MRYVFMRFPGGKAKAVTFSYDDGCKQDKRLAEIFDKYGMKCTFNHNSDRQRKEYFSKDEVHEYFLSTGHEIAVHGEFHRANGTLRPIEGIREVLNCRLELEEKCDRIIRGMAYPDTGIRKMTAGGTYRDIKNYLTELDIAYARTLGGDNDSFLMPEDFHAWMPTAHHNNPEIFDYIDKFNAIDMSSSTYRSSRHPRLFYIWGHSYEFDRNDNWDRIEEICKRLGGKDDVYYATNIEIYECFEAYQRLIYSADGRRIYNPSVRSVWLDVDGTVYEINPGEAIIIN